MLNTELGIPISNLKRIVIIGAGFGGLKLARKLIGSSFQVVLIDKNNYHTFQPLLYQVATGGIEADSIAYPIRNSISAGKNVFFRLASVWEVVSEKNLIITDKGSLGYHFLVIATGGKPNFYGNQNLEKNSFVLKSITNALDLRSFIFQTIEESLFQPNKQLNSIVIAGGGPTGIEVAGALADLRNSVFPRDYPEINFSLMKITLAEAGPAILTGMSKASAKNAIHSLKKLGVEVKLNHPLKEIQKQLLFFEDGSTMDCDLLIWCAGITGSPISGLTGSCLLKSGRYLTDGFNRITGYENIFAIGDIAAVEESSKAHPMLAPVAIQQAVNLAKNLKTNNLDQWKKFTYFDKGVMATIGRNKAVLDFGPLNLHGFIAWFSWVFVHLMTLVGFRNRMVVFINWVWNYVAYDSAIRLIIRPFIKEKLNK